MSIIYETKGRAKEYYRLGCHIYRGCSHGCTYCYNTKGAKVNSFYQARPPARGYLERLDVEAQALAARGERRHILLSFDCDPYQPLDDDLRFTRKTIAILKDVGLPVAILTKAGRAACRDFDLLDSNDHFGVTLTVLNPELARQHEPHAANPEDRIWALAAAREAGLFTFVSCEPVLYPSETLKLIETCAPETDLFRIGKLNHEQPPQAIDWELFTTHAIELCKRLKATYYVKADLARYLGRSGYYGWTVPKTGRPKLLDQLAAEGIPIC